MKPRVAHLFRDWLTSVRRSFRSLQWLLAAALALAASPSAYGWNLHLNTGFGGFQSTCPGHSLLAPVRTAGALTTLRVRVLPDDYQNITFPYYGITDTTWPAWLTIEVGLQPDSGLTWQPSAELARRLQMRYYLKSLQIQYDSAWRRTGHVPEMLESRFPEYNFLVQLPEDLAGQQLSFRVRINHPEWGNLETVDILTVVAPCTDTDRLRVADSYVSLYRQARDYERAIAAADSLIAVGWRSAWGLGQAYTAARVAERYDAALRFLDIGYEANGSVIIMPFHSKDAPGDRRFYEKQRAEVLKLMNEQQQR